ncbi:MAG: undecaprenyl-diphosphate phosphatase [Ruminococcaceae bacterium]|nr:undecaprenyl-diphosphate phosphatase [Oscillospiraceae bacterium]
MFLVEIIKTVLIGIIQGITEWLPISSTGHMILFNALWPLDVPSEFWEMFSVVIQLGSIMAVVVLYFRKLNPFAPSKSAQEKKSTWSLWAKVLVGSVPAAVVGLLINDFIDALLYEGEGELYVRTGGALVIAAALIVYGLAFIIIEKYKKGKNRCETVDDISYSTALGIGAFQMLALIPGTSRSGSTIIGSRLLGVSRVAAAEFSFFLAIPVMAGASLLKVVKFLLDGISMTGELWAILAIGCIVAFLVSVAAIRFLTDFLKKHTFIPFGIYRIILGAAVIIWAIFR